MKVLFYRITIFTGRNGSDFFIHILFSLLAGANKDKINIDSVIKASKANFCRYQEMNQSVPVNCDNTIKQNMLLNVDHGTYSRW